MQSHDRIRLQNMLDATKEALEFVQGMRRADLDRNRMLVLSLVKELEIIGEAAGKVSPNFAPSTVPSLGWISVGCVIV